METQQEGNATSRKELFKNIGFVPEMDKPETKEDRILKTQEESLNRQESMLQSQMVFENIRRDVVKYRLELAHLLIENPQIVKAMEAGSPAPEPQEEPIDISEAGEQLGAGINDYQETNLEGEVLELEGSEQVTA